MTLQLYLNIFAALIGLCIGSFLNVVALRQLKGEEFVVKSSYCPKCKTPLKWYDNIPVLSYALLFGRCRFCKEKISPQYPIVELFTGFIFAMLFFCFGLSFKTLFLMIASALMIVICITDFKEQAVFDANSYPIVVLGIFYNTFGFGDISLLSAALGALGGYFVFEILARIGIPMFGERIFGDGDSLIAAGLGAFFGWKALLPIIVLSFFIQVTAGLPVVIKNMAKEKDYKSLTAIVLLLLALVLAYLNKFLVTKVEFIYLSLGVSAVTILCAVFATVILLKGMKERQSFTMLPFGPALIFSGFIYMFAGQNVLTYLSKFFT